MENIVPRHYKLHFEPDLKAFVFKGKTEIALEAKERVKEIVLHAVDLGIKDCRIRLDGSFEKALFSPPDEENQTFRIILPREFQGAIQLSIDYEGKINDTMLGFYRSRYVDSDGKEKFIAVTQFEETEARKAFPCLDRPDRKATFDVEFLIDADLVGLSNMPIAEEQRLSGNKKLVRFERTPVMSTYLLFFGVGEFEIMEDRNRVLLRAITTPGKIDLAREGLQFARKCVDFFEEHFATAYPLPKLDLIAIPDFAFGAMENWGAMTFRENLLLVYPGITSRTTRKRLFTVIAHEIVHQWFGDLVSPAHWKYLWLNESFATFYGEFVVDTIYPDWATMETFLLETTSSALGRDSLHKTVPVELGEEAKITASTAPIIYDKGGSVMRMAISFLGGCVKPALKDYFVRHAYATAVSSDLWEAFSRTAPDEEVVDMMTGWVTQPGHPMIEVQKKRHTLLIKQERFTYLNRGIHEEKWHIPLTVLTLNDSGQMNVMKRLISEKEEELELPQETVSFKLNHEQTGFYRVKYELAEWERLGGLISDKKISGCDRFGLQEDLFAFVRRGDFKLSYYLDFIEKHFREEDHHLALRGIIKNLSLLNLILEEDARGEIKKIGRAFTERILEGIGYDPSSEEELSISSLRSSALWSAAQFGSRRIFDFSLGKFQVLINDGIDIHADIADSVQRVAAFSDDGSLPELIRRFKATDSEQERMTLAASFGCVSLKNMQKSVDFALDEMPPALKYVPLSVMTGNPALSADLWTMFSRNRNRLEKLPPIYLERILIGVISIGGLFAEDEVKKYFSSYAPEGFSSYQKHLRGTMDMALEMLEVNLKLRLRV
ncbi:MAG: M1 family metallopeptidase [Candidatus Aminicenantes bacterium]|nr:M1 family metallopeptidase [Candidatus Aminicenantes bacterium]